MSVFVFAGPSLGRRDRPLDGITILPPVRRGDVLALLAHRPEAIGIIDGVFHQSPSVLHKEILEAIGAGVPVLGAASMGALRAAELERFGMRGVGQIFEWYRNGTLMEDDAVALTYGPAELGYPALTIPIVDILATTKDLIARKLIKENDGAILVDLATSVHFSNRSWKFIKDKLSVLVDETVYQVITENWINQKQRDAHALLRQISLEGLTTGAALEELPLTTWLSHAYHCHAQIDNGLPLRVFSAFTQIVAETFPSVYARTVEDQYLASLYEGKSYEDGGWKSDAALGALTGRLDQIRYQADLVLSLYATRWPGATREDAIGAALTCRDKKTAAVFLSQPPQRVAEPGRYLRNRAGDQSNLLAVVAFLREPEAKRIVDLARHAVQMRKDAITTFSAGRLPNSNDAIQAWCARFGNRPISELSEFCDERGLSITEFVSASAIVEEYERKLVRARRINYIT